MTLAKACEGIAAYDLKKLSDDRTILRRETGEDFITPPELGRLNLDLDDAAAVCGYADLRRAGYPVKLAGTIMSRVRTAMREYPEADQLTTVLLDNGFTFTLPSASLDLASGFNSGRYVVAATLIDVRNVRERVQRVIEAYEPGIGVEDAA
ncbi:MAG: hypothetical protein H0T81_08045 [Sphingomonas sp.]|nr:hypothetical protein [Sphingomonas sp.]